MWGEHQHEYNPFTSYIPYCFVHSFLPAQGRDSTVFFLNIRAGYEPIGFVRTPAPVTTIQWSAKKEVRTPTVYPHCSSLLSRYKTLDLTHYRSNYTLSLRVNSVFVVQHVL